MSKIRVLGFRGSRWVAGSLFPVLPVLAPLPFLGRIQTSFFGPGLWSFLFSDPKARQDQPWAEDFFFAHPPWMRRSGGGNQSGGCE